MVTTNDRGVARLGFVVPVSNSNLEPDMVMSKPAGVSVHFMRAGGYDLDQVPDSAQMRQFAEASLDSVLQALVAVRPDLVAYGCTSATLSMGPQYDRVFSERISSYTGVPGITAAGALVESLSDLKISCAGFASPYTEQLNREGAEFLSKCGLDIVEIAYVGDDLGNYGQGRLQPHQVFELGLRADHPEADAIILSCTDMRALEVVDRLEAELDKPVVTSNQALMYIAAKRLGLESRGPGKLGTLSSAIVDE